MSYWMKFSIENRLLILAAGLLVMLMGYSAYRELPIDAFPDVSPSLVQVFTETDGLAPEEVEKYITYPIEVSMAGLPDVERIRSVSNLGLSVVNIYFEDQVDIYFARQLVSNRLQSASDSIPADLGHPKLGPIATGMGLILYYYLDDPEGAHSLEELRTIQDWFVKPRLLGVSGVTEVLGIGGHEKQYQVRVNPVNLIRYDVSINDVLERISRNNGNVGAQFIEQNSEEIVIRALGLAESREDIGQIVLKSFHGNPIYVSDVAEVVIGGAVRRGLQTRNGSHEVVAGMVVKLAGENSAEVIALVEEEIEQLNQSLPGKVELVSYYKQSSLVEACLATVRSALVQGAIAVALVILVFMRAWRPGLVIGLSIPFSVLFATLGMSYFGMSANLMSLGGLAIAVGMLVDGAIVVVENVDRRLSLEGSDVPRLRLVVDACAEVMRPIIFATVIIITVFAPLFGLQGVEGKTFRPLAYTVALAMLGALSFVVVLSPALIATFLRPRNISSGTFSTFISRLYSGVLDFFIRRRWAVVAIAVSILGVGVGLLPRLGSEFTPRLQEGTLIVRLTMAPSISLAESQRTTQIVERRLMDVPEISGVVSRIGRGEVGAHADPVNNSEILVLLRPREQWTSASSQEDLENVIRSRLGRVPGAVINFTQPIAMTVDELLEGVRAELAIKVFGDDVDILKEHAQEVARVIAQVPGAADVQVDQVSGTPQLVIHIDRSAVARYGINVEDVQRTISASIGGQVAGQVFEGVRRFDVVVRLDESYRETPDSIRALLVDSPDGFRIPLKELASFEFLVGPRLIRREDGQRFIAVQCNVIDRDIGSFVEEARESVRETVALSPGYLVSWGGQFRLQEQANRRLALTVPVTLLAAFLLLYASFGYGRSALTVILNIPLALVGGLAALAISGQNLSVPASVGLIALFGVALGNGMVLVSAINRLMLGGTTPRQACIEGAGSRLRAVLMTATTTALGLSPLLFSVDVGSEVQRPLATVVVGGLVTSTLVTLFLLPAFYEWVLPESGYRRQTTDEIGEDAGALGHPSEVPSPSV